MAYDPANPVKFCKRNEKIPDENNKINCMEYPKQYGPGEAVKTAKIFDQSNGKEQCQQKAKTIYSSFDQFVLIELPDKLIKLMN